MRQPQDDFTLCATSAGMRGRTALVTGASSGTGLHIARGLAARGARVLIASRDPARLRAARDYIVRRSGNSDVVAHAVDFESLASVRRLAAAVRAEPRLDVLVNNVGAIGLADRLTGDGLQLMMQVNYFGAFLLTALLLPLLRASAPSRVVDVSSLALLLGDLDFDRWNEVGAYSNFGFYCNAKLATVLHAQEMDRRLRGTGVSVFSMDPGLGKSEFFRNFENPLIRVGLNAALQKFGRPLERVATMAEYLAAAPGLERASGRHFRDCREFFSTWLANDTALAATLWSESRRLVRLSDDEDWERAPP